ESRSLSERALVAYGNRYSEFFYQRRHEVRMPEPDAFRADPQTMAAALDTVARALELREREPFDTESVKAKLKAHLVAHPRGAAVYPYLRAVFGQSHGPNITTMLAILPHDYLTIVQLVLSG